jgi:endonuclease YncB( thermonuclease family)
VHFLLARRIASSGDYDVLRQINYLIPTAAFLLSASAAVASYNGPARVIDGDTIDIAGVRVRLLGIDAPEGKQHCERDGVPWLCGQEAAKALRELVGSSPVSCVEHDRDRYKRSVSVCKLPDGTDLGAFMVSNGYAVAYARYSKLYVEDEKKAREAKRGLWSGVFKMPWEWRRRDN